MMKLFYTPMALHDLELIKLSIIENFNIQTANQTLQHLTSTARQLEIFPYAGPPLNQLISISTDYRYLFIKPNYIIYRIEIPYVNIIRILNEKQDFEQVLFGKTVTT